jgi:cytochrome P450
LHARVQIFSARDHSDGSSWQLARKAVAPAFHPRHVSMMNDLCSGAYDEWVARSLEPASRSGAPIDICAEVLAMTVVVICSAGLCYEPSQQECIQLLDDLDNCVKVVFRIYAVIPFSRYFWWAFADGRKGHAARGRTLAFCAKLLEHYRSLPEGARRADSIIGRIDANPTYPSDAQRYADILAFLVAGHDTTALSLAWLLYHLAKQPQAQAALRAELRAMPVAERASSPLLNATIKESMRLDPVAAGGSLRVTTRDFKIGGAAGDAVVPAGCIVWVPYCISFRHASIGAEPHAFRPERWLADGAAKALDEAIFPWASGRRNCVGQALARAELYTLVPRLVCDYTWEVVNDPKPQLGLTWKPQGLTLRARCVQPQA